MGIFRGKRKLKSNSALAIAAGCAVVFMFIATIISVFLYKKRMDEAENLLAEAKYSQYQSYVVMISSDDESDFWQQVYTAAKEYGDEYGVYVDMLSESIDNNYRKNELIEMAIESDCDAIFVEGDDTLETAEMVAKANAQGIAVFTLNSDMAVESRVSYIGPNSYTVASLYGKALLDNLVRQNQVMVFGGNSINKTYADTFISNIQNVLEGADIVNAPLEYEEKIVEKEGAFATEEYIQNLFKENTLAPVVICLDEDSTDTFYQAMIDYNKVGTILLLGSNRSETILTGIKQGVIASTVYVDPTDIGKAAAGAYVEYRDSGYVSEYISVEAKIINKDNVDAELQGVAND